MGLVVRDSKILSVVKEGFEKSYKGVELDVHPDVAFSLSAFNEEVDRKFSVFIKQDEKRITDFMVTINVFSLSAAQRDQLDAVISEGSWQILSGDRRHWNIGTAIRSDAADIALKFLIKSGRLCKHCMQFTAFDQKAKTWFCAGCGRFVGCHEGTDVGLGSVTDDEGRELRRETHVVVDSIWRDGIMNRSAVYKELASLLQEPLAYCHIGMLDAKQCELAKQWATIFRKEAQCAQVL